MQQPSPDQRQTLRYPARVRVLYFSKGQPRGVDADCENISKDGLFVKTRRRGPSEGTPVTLLLNFEGDSELMVEGVVRWQGEVPADQTGAEGAGMGIEFTQMEPAVREAIEKRITLIGRTGNQPRG